MFCQEFCVFPPALVGKISVYGDLCVKIAGTFFHEIFRLDDVISGYYYHTQTLGWSSSGDICPGHIPIEPLESPTHY